MTTPLRPVPEAVLRWIDRRRRLRWCDALVAWVVLGAVVAAMLGQAHLEVAAVVSLGLVVAGTRIQPLRVRWRPISGGWACGSARVAPGRSGLVRRPARGEPRRGDRPPRCRLVIVRPTSVGRGHQRAPRALPARRRRPLTTRRALTWVACQGVWGPYRGPPYTYTLLARTGDERTGGGVKAYGGDFELAVSGAGPRPGAVLVGSRGRRVRLDLHIWRGEMKRLRRAPRD